MDLNHTPGMLMREALNVDVSLLKRLVGILETRSPGDNTALELTAMIKLAGTTLDLVRANILEQANNDFMALQTRYTDVKAYPVGDMAMVKKFTGKATWVYPKKVATIAAQLKDAQKTAQADKTARKVEAKDPDPKYASLFAMTLK